MRVAPLILAIIGILGLLYPDMLLDSEKGGGRWIFVIILLLAIITFWRNFYKRKRYHDK